MNENTISLLVVLNSILFIFAIALANNTFKHYKTTDQIFDLQPLNYDDYWIVKWADYMLNVSLFQATTYNGSIRKIQKSNSFSC